MWPLSPEGSRKLAGGDNHRYPPQPEPDLEGHRIAFASQICLPPAALRDALLSHAYRCLSPPANIFRPCRVSTRGYSFSENALAARKAGHHLKAKAPASMRAYLWYPARRRRSLWCAIRVHGSSVGVSRRTPRRRIGRGRRRLLQGRQR